LTGGYAAAADYTSNCVTTEELTGVLYYKTPIQQFCFFYFFFLNWRVYLLQNEGKKGNTKKIGFPLRIYERKWSRIPILLGRLM